MNQGWFHLLATQKHQTDTGIPHTQVRYGYRNTSHTGECGGMDAGGGAARGLILREHEE